jgi:hypothetical protein
MAEQSPISLFVKLGYWDVYRLNVVLTAAVFRKVLYIWGFVALLWLTLSLLLLFRPSPEHDCRHNAEYEPVEMGVRATDSVCVYSPFALRPKSVEG